MVSNPGFHSSKIKMRKECLASRGVGVSQLVIHELYREQSPYICPAGAETRRGLVVNSRLKNIIPPQNRAFMPPRELL